MNKLKRSLIPILAVIFMLLIGTYAMASSLTMPKKLKIPSNGTYDLSLNNDKPSGLCFTRLNTITLSVDQIGQKKNSFGQSLDSIRV